MSITHSNRADLESKSFKGIHLYTKTFRKYVTSLIYKKGGKYYFFDADHLKMTDAPIKQVSSRKDLSIYIEGESGTYLVPFDICYNIKKGTVKYLQKIIYNAVSDYAKEHGYEPSQISFYPNATFDPKDYTE